MKIEDRRYRNVSRFASVREGVIFTKDESNLLYIKTDNVSNGSCTKLFSNTVCLNDGSVSITGENETIFPIYNAELELE